MANFISNMKGTLNSRKQLTENGAVGYSTSGHELLDLNFATSSLRHESEESIKDRFTSAYYENPLLAIKWLFKVGDVREGDGERRTFRVILDWMVDNKPEVLKAVLTLIPEYSRWDNLARLADTKMKSDVVNIVKEQLKDDLIAMKEKGNASLLAKWLPSCNASSKETKRLAKIFVKELGLSEKKYRKMLSALRKYLKVVEVDMCKKEWSNINYEAVPSRANLIYNNAFLRNDEERRREYLGKLQKGEAKINSSVLFPHDIVSRYMESGYYSKIIRSVDSAIEAMWKALPDFVKGNGNTLVVGDGSGSMYSRIDSHSNVMAVDVANALAIYFAEHMTGQFKDQYITFGSNPHLVDFSKCATLRDKIQLACKNNDCGSTDIQKVFQLILRTAINNHMSQGEMPNNVLIISDMEFNSSYCCHFGSRSVNTPTLFDDIEREYNLHGYQLPRLVFWNVNSRTNTIPVQQNPAGVALVSGFSPTTCKMVLSNKTDPYDVLLEALNSERYQAVEDAVKGLTL